MDVYGIYIGDTSLSYGTMRNSVYRDYEKFPYGTFEKNIKKNETKDYYSKVQEKCQKVKNQRTEKQSCPFCQEQKKRPLIGYMKKRQMHRDHEKICEEDEDIQSRCEENSTTFANRTQENNRTETKTN